MAKTKRAWAALWADDDGRLLLRMPASALKVWLCIRLHEGCRKKSWVSNVTIAKETGMERKTVGEWKRVLLQYGWLEQLGTIPSRTGGSPVTVLRTQYGAPMAPITGGTCESPLPTATAGQIDHWIEEAAETGEQ